MTRRDRGVAAQVALEALLAFVRLEMQLELISIGETLVAALASQYLITGVQLLHVNAQICFATTSGGTIVALQRQEEVTLEDAHHPKSKFLTLNTGLLPVWIKRCALSELLCVKRW